MSDVLFAVFGGWRAEPVPIVVAAAALLVYGLGARRLATTAPEQAPGVVEKGCLVAGVAVILVALLSPVDDQALRLQWVHMVQHVLLLVVAPPLVVLGRPARTAAAALGPRASAVLDAAQRGLQGRSRIVLAALAAAFLLVAMTWTWHIPALYNLTLRDEVVHNVEHTAFLVVGLLFWTAALPRRGTAGLGMIGRSAVVLVGLVGSWMLALYIGYAPSVLFAYTGAGGLSALADQQLAAGVMWVPASVPFVAVMVALGARWLDDDARAAAAETRQRSEATA